MSAVLISGASSQVAEVAAAVRRHGATVTEVADLDAVGEVCTAAGADAFDSYVQLPSTFQASGDTAIARVHDFYAGGVLARFGALDAAMPALAPAARLTFVLGQLPPEAATPEDAAARRALVRVLGQAARADTAGGVAVRFLDAGTSPDDIAFVAVGGDLARRRLIDRLSELDDYADWRVELIGLVSVET